MTALLVALAAQFGCQLFKVGYYWIARGRFDPRWLASAGGMPSAHAAFVVALAVFVGLRSGFGSELFAVSAVFASIVVYDAYRLRGTVERHARVLQALAAAHPDVTVEKLHDMVGHTVPEIAVGIAAGAGVAVAAWLVLG
jgi:acid phosphatase family membrane protein YuiD